MKRRKSIKKKRRVNRPLVILSLAIVIVISLSAVSYLNQLPRAKKPADEYFEIFDATVNDGEFQEPSLGQGGSYENSSVLIIYSVSYKLRAVEGDAHNVVVRAWAKADFVDFEVISKDQSRYVEQWSSRTAGGFLTRKAENGKFPFPVKLTSDEAEGTITIYL